MEPKFFTTPKDFRQWLKDHHDKENELWVGFYKKATGLPSMNWSESVDQASVTVGLTGFAKPLMTKVTRSVSLPAKPKAPGVRSISKR